MAKHEMTVESLGKVGNEEYWKVRGAGVKGNNYYVLGNRYTRQTGRGSRHASLMNPRFAGLRSRIATAIAKATAA